MEGQMMIQRRKKNFDFLLLILTAKSQELTFFPGGGWEGSAPAPKTGLLEITNYVFALFFVFSPGEKRVF